MEKAVHTDKKYKEVQICCNTTFAMVVEGQTVLLSGTVRFTLLMLPHDGNRETRAYACDWQVFTSGIGVSELFLSVVSRSVSLLLMQ